MKSITLTQGKVAIVDDENYEQMVKIKWCFDHGYAVVSRRKNSPTIYMHAMIAGTPRGMETDHINGNRLDNQKENLRICSCSQNRMNSKKPGNNTSGYKGVSWNKERQKWEAGIGVDHKLKHLGRYENKIDAVLAYNNAALLYYGCFARINDLVRL